jgi:hypothetical protein
VHEQVPLPVRGQVVANRVIRISDKILIPFVHTFVPLDIVIQAYSL